MAAKRARGKAGKKPASRSSRASRARQPPAAARKTSRHRGGGFRAKVRMYRQGLGDCFLVTLPRRGRDYTILIDCGVIVGTPAAAEKMRAVVEDIAATTKEIDLLIATHEHWDHLSGFLQAADSFGKFNVHEIWLSWTETPDDELARRLAGEREQALTALRLAAHRMQLSGEDSAAADELAGILEFSGAARGTTTREALEAVQALGPVRYRRPEEPSVAPQGVAARLYVLGPPHDEELIRRISPLAREPETYALLFDAFMNAVLPGLFAAESDEGQGEAVSPFGTLYAIPVAVARDLPFFREHYWGTFGAQWRRIDAAWLDVAAELALRLDHLTNNTSLALAIELADGDVLLFAADAQVGNWLSWHNRAWTADGQTVTGTDLIERAILYKVGHHGSHNATLRDKGLELMGRLQVAMLPVDRDVAVKNRWVYMPLTQLVERLAELTDGRLLRSDQDVARPWAGLTSTELYHEMTF